MLIPVSLTSLAISYPPQPGSAVSESVWKWQFNLTFYHLFVTLCFGVPLNNLLALSSFPSLLSFPHHPALFHWMSLSCSGWNCIPREVLAPTKPLLNWGAGATLEVLVTGHPSSHHTISFRLGHLLLQGHICSALPYVWGEEGGQSSGRGEQTGQAAVCEAGPWCHEVSPH